MGVTLAARAGAGAGTGAGRGAGKGSGAVRAALTASRTGASKTATSSAVLFLRARLTSLGFFLDSARNLDLSCLLVRPLLPLAAGKNPVMRVKSVPHCRRAP